MIVGFYAFTPYKNIFDSTLESPGIDPVELSNNIKNAREDRKKAESAGNGESIPDLEPEQEAGPEPKDITPIKTA